MHLFELEFLISFNHFYFVFLTERDKTHIKESYKEDFRFPLNEMETEMCIDEDWRIGITLKFHSFSFYFNK